jgi:hypothetical protein
MNHKQQALKTAAKIGRLIGANKAAMCRPCPDYQDESGYKATLASIQGIIKSLEEDLSLALTYCK